MAAVGALAYLTVICLINAPSVDRLAGFIDSGVTNSDRALKPARSVATAFLSDCA